MKLTAQNIWFTSDTHFHHSNIVRGVTRWRNEDGEIPFNQVRDFDTLEDMNEAIIKGINSHVGEDDWLIHLGDWSFGGFDKIEMLRSELICKNIVLMYGNHDHHILANKNGVKDLFVHSAHYEELTVEIGGEKTTFILSHYPICSWNKMGEGAIMLHGHQHLRGDLRFGNGKRMDVGLCGSPEFRPYHIREILDLMKDRELEEWPSGHHQKRVENSLDPYGLNKRTGTPK